MASEKKNCIPFMVLTKIYKKKAKRTYSGTKIKRGEENERQLYLDFLIGNAEKGTYDKGYMGMGKTHLFPHEDSVISMLVRKLMVTQEQKYLSPKGVGWGIGRI